MSREHHLVFVSESPNRRRWSVHDHLRLPSQVLYEGGIALLDQRDEKYLEVRPASIPACRQTLTDRETQATEQTDIVKA
jgi:hypothetical protein